MKKLTLILGLVWYCLYCTAQETVVNNVTVPPHEQIESFFSQFDASQATTGIFLDRGYRLAPLEKYDGSPISDTSNITDWKMAYTSLRVPK